MSAGLYTVAQVARFMGVRPQEAARMIEHEKLPAVTLPGKQKPVRKVALHAFHGWLSARHTGEAFMTVEELASEIAAAQADGELGGHLALRAAVEMVYGEICRRAETLKAGMLKGAA